MSDQAVRDQALDPAQSFIVQAPAGSGKTELLTQRLLVLLSQVDKPSHILAMTFTRKAAHEMQHRLLSALKRGQNPIAPEEAYAQKTWALARKVLEQDKARGWDLLNRPQLLNIKTIDGFCAQIVQQLPNSAELGGRLSVTDVPGLLYGEAVQRLFEGLHAESSWQNSLLCLLQHFDNRFDLVENVLKALLACREQWLPLIQNKSDSAAWRFTLTETLSHIRQNWVGQLEALISTEQKQTLEKLSSAAFETLNQSWAESKVARWAQVAEWLLTAKGTWRQTFNKRQGFLAPSDCKNAEEKRYWQDQKQAIKALVAELAEVPKLDYLLHGVCSLPDEAYSDAQWQLVDALLELLPILVAHLKVLMQEQGQTDFTEISIAAITALSDEDPTDILLRLDQQLQHILVDEFQDTSQMQFRLLEQLTSGWLPDDGRTLFLVGDPMQSIYRFRQADVGLFLQAKHEGVGSVPLTYLTLRRNFRSDQGLIEWYNRYFPFILTSFEDVLTGAIPYTSAEAVRAYDGSPGCAWLVAQDEHLLADQTVQQLLAWRAEHPDESIAVLVRDRTSLREVLPALQQANMPYVAQDIEPLVGQDVVVDLVHLYRALMNPMDRVAWLAVLRAPWCGLMLEDLLTLCQAAGAEHGLWYVLSQAAVLAALTPLGQEKLKRLLPILAQALELKGLWPTRKWLERTWWSLHGPACLAGEHEVGYAEEFLCLVEQLDAQDELTLARLNHSLSQLKAPVSPLPQAIQVMTIHKSKGLEFDRVIVLGLERGRRPKDQPLLAWQTFLNRAQQPESVLAVRHGVGQETDKTYQFILNQQQEQADYEQGRLLYVALTRAKKALVLAAVVPDLADQLEKLKPASRSFLSLLHGAGATENIDLGQLCLEEATLSPASNQPDSISNQLQFLPPEWVPPKKVFNPARWLTQKEEPLGEDTLWQLDRYTAQVIGTLTHEALAILSQQPLPDCGTHWWQQYQPYFKAQCQQKLPHTETASALAAIQEAVTHTLSDPKGRWCLKDHPEAKSEWPLLNKQGEVRVVDRSFVEEGVFWIVDYKTSQPAPGQTMADFLQAEEASYRHQLLEYQSLVRHWAVTDFPVKMALYFPLIATWHDVNVGIS